MAAAVKKVNDAGIVGDAKCVDYYDKWSRDYDKDLITGDYQGPILVAQYLSKHLDQNKKARIMDMCAGTGMGAIELKKLGFHNLDALDGSEEMLRVAKERKLYNEVHCTYLNPGEQTKIPTGAYDGVVCIGSFLGGHLKPEVADEFIRILKPGGYCVIGMREAWLEIPEYKGILDQYLVNLKGAKLISRDSVPKWFNNLSGVIYVFQKI